MLKYSKLFALALAFLLVGCSISDGVSVVEDFLSNYIDISNFNEISYSSNEGFDFSSIPEYNGKPYVLLNNNKADFTEGEKSLEYGYEHYSELDELGRCGYAIAVVGLDTMPSKKRGSIGMIKPSGWHTVKYDFVDGKYLYNRCHLIGYQLTGENANVNNLITGTRYLNMEGMLDFENAIDDYVEETGNHVLYKVKPIFISDELVARGVHMQAYSLEDNGEGLQFNAFAYNVQPGVNIDYVLGGSFEIEIVD